MAHGGRGHAVGSGDRSHTEITPGTPGVMLDALAGFVHELRAAGLPVSMTENLDAMRAVQEVPWEDRDAMRAALATTLVKHHRHRRAFDVAFDVYFGLRAPDAAPDTGAEVGGGPAAAGGGGDPLSDAELAELLLAALRAMDRDALRDLAARAVTRYAGMEPGRPVGGTYYLYRTLRHLDLDALAAALTARLAEGAQAGADDLESRFAREEAADRIAQLRRLVEAEIRRRLVADRGVAAMARTLRAPLPEDVDFMHATREEMQALQRAIEPLTRALAARLAQRRRRRHRGHLDFRATVRHSLSYGGVPAEPKFRRPRPHRPEIMVVADVSGSVASFARFTLQLVYAMAGQFSKVRSWVFIDGIDEVTRFFTEADDLADAVHRVNTEADVVWVDGHSDYGHAFEVFAERHLGEVTPRTSLIVLGDARNNYHASKAEVLGALRRKARRLYWLNPEPRGYWDTGDSIISEYLPHCDGVYECRNLRQLERFVTAVVEA